MVKQDGQLIDELQRGIGSPPDDAVARSRRRVQGWLAQSAPLIEWDVVAETPLGPVFIAASEHGVCSVDFGVSQNAFLERLDPLARSQHNPAALAAITRQLREYFRGERTGFDLPVDLTRLTPFHRSVLQTIRAIPVGTVWTYGQVAQAIGKPRAGRAVGQALGHNPVPIVVPCHRVIAGNGSLGGYSGGGGLNSKRLLLHLEGAL